MSRYRKQGKVERVRLELPDFIPFADRLQQAWQNKAEIEADLAAQTTDELVAGFKKRFQEMQYTVAASIEVLRRPTMPEQVRAQAKDFLCFFPPDVLAELVQEQGLKSEDRRLLETELGYSNGTLDHKGK